MEEKAKEERRKQIEEMEKQKKEEEERKRQEIEKQGTGGGLFPYFLSQLVACLLL